ALAVIHSGNIVIGDGCGRMVLTQYLFSDSQSFLIPLQSDIVLALAGIHKGNIVIGGGCVRMVLAQYLFSDSQSFLIPLQSILVVSVFARTTPQKHIQVSTTLRKVGIVRGV